MGVRRRSTQRQTKGGAKEGAPTDASAKAQNDLPVLSPGFDEVLASVESLYADELKPFGRILRKRVAERATMALGREITNEENLPDVDIKHLRNTCEGSDRLRVEPEEGGDWSALIAGCPEAFVNVYSPQDCYPETMWGMAATYFEALTGDDMYLPGGRYSCAQALQARDLPFLQGRSLGQVCHIVQLAISQKKVLGYLNGAVVPYARSQSMVKEQCAQFKAPCTVPAPMQGTNAPPATAGTAGPPGNNLVMATWETARRCLADILDTAARAAGPTTLGMVPLSNVKRLFRSRFHTELSETMLGHSKLSELLQDERFSDLCTVQLQGHGYIVMQVTRQDNPSISLADTLPVYGGDTPASEPRRVEFSPSHAASSSSRTQPFCTDEPLTLDMNEAGVTVGASPSTSRAPGARWPPAFSPTPFQVERTFLHVSPPLPSPMPNARRRSSSLPKDVGSDKGACESQASSSQAPSQPSRGQQFKLFGTSSVLYEATDSTIDSTTGSAADANRRPLFGCSGLDSPAPSDLTVELPLSCRTDQQSPGPALDDPVKVLLRGAADAKPKDRPVKIGETGELLDFGSAEDGEPRRKLQFCVDEPLALDDAGVSLFDAPRTHDGFTPQPLPAAQRWPSLASPAIAATPGLSKVQNTFIHLQKPPPTPFGPTASRRSSSLPKNVGSDKNTWEATCQAYSSNYRERRQRDHGPPGDFSKGNCAPTPTVYADYAGPNMPCTIATSPMPLQHFVPPSPALTSLDSPGTWNPRLGQGLGFHTKRPALAKPGKSPASSKAPPPPMSPGGTSVIKLANLL